MTSLLIWCSSILQEKQFPSTLKCAIHGYFPISQSNHHNIMMVSMCTDQAFSTLGLEQCVQSGLQYSRARTMCTDQAFSTLGLEQCVQIRPSATLGLEQCVQSRPSVL